MVKIFKCVLKYDLFAIMNFLMNLFSSGTSESGNSKIKKSLDPRIFPSSSSPTHQFQNISLSLNFPKVPRFTFQFQSFSFVEREREGERESE